MSQTQRPRVMHKATLQAILKQLITLSTDFLTKIIELPDYSTPVLPPPTNPGIAAIILTPPTLVMPATKEICSDTVSSGTWMSRTPRRVSGTGVDGSTPGDIGNFNGIVETSSPYMIVTIGNAPHCGLNLI